MNAGVLRVNDWSSSVQSKGPLCTKSRYFLFLLFSPFSPFFIDNPSERKWKGKKCYSRELREKKGERLEVNGEKKKMLNGNKSTLFSSQIESSYKCDDDGDDKAQPFSNYSISPYLLSFPISFLADRLSVEIISYRVAYLITFFFTQWVSPDRNKTY